MKTKNTFFEIILIVILVGFVTSCSKYENNSFPEMTSKISSLRLNVGISGYVDEVATRSASTWKDDSKIYIYSSSLSGTATYKNGTWVLSYTGNIVGENDCKIYYFENPVTNGETSVDMNAFTAIYADELAKINKIGDEIVLTGVLRPKSARIRFKKTSDDVTFSGFTSYNKYDNNLNNLLEQKETSIELSATSDFTPYIYLAYEGHNIDVSLIANGCLFKRTLTEEHLAPGNSGYFVTPTKEHLNGWTFVGEAPIPVWDGNIASKFAGGKGTYVNPYIIKTGGQLALIHKYSDAYFKLESNIDLNNLDWYPIERFLGNLDGNGKTIKNLKIRVNERYVGLFSELSGKVHDLNIVGVQIDALDSQASGSLCGKSTGSVGNCTVEFTDNSYLKGNKNVGGLIGWIDEPYSYGDCCVYSNSDKYLITGESTIGGVVGKIKTVYAKEWIINNLCSNINIAGLTVIGGVVGDVDTTQKGCGLTRCSYKGKLKGESTIGGILGISSTSVGSLYINKSKSDVVIDCQNGYCGGIYGYSARGQIKYCYSTGVINVEKGRYICGIGGSNVNCCYTTMTCDNSEFSPISIFPGDDNATVYPRLSHFDSSDPGTRCRNNDIVNIMKFKTPDDDVWSFDNTWVWTGTVNGENIQVVCPRLLWEKQELSVKRRQRR